MQVAPPLVGERVELVCGCLLYTSTEFQLMSTARPQQMEDGREVANARVTS